LECFAALALLPRFIEDYSFEEYFQVAVLPPFLLAPPPSRLLLSWPSDIMTHEDLLAGVWMLI
jgi:hypothetical protein